MADFLSELASGVGVEDEQAQHGVGALLSTLKSKLDPEAFARLKNSIPHSEEMVSAFQDKADSTGGGLMDTMKNMAGKFFGKQDSDEPQAHFAKAGLSPDQLKSLLPKLHDMLADKVPSHVMEQIKQHVPGFGPAPEETPEEE
jgi:uncharacterized protein (DUF2267 family)